MASLTLRTYAALARAGVPRLRPPLRYGANVRRATLETTSTLRPVPTMPPSVSPDISLIHRGALPSSLDGIAPDFDDFSASFTVPAVTSIAPAHATGGRAVQTALCVMKLPPSSAASTTVRMTGAALFPPLHIRGFHSSGAVLHAAGSVPTTRKVFFKREGTDDYAKLMVAPDADVADLKKEVVEELGLQGVQLDTVTLHLETKDEATKEWIVAKEPLDSTATVAEELEGMKVEKVRIVVKGLPAAAATVMPIPDDWMRDQVEGVSIYDPTVVTRREKCEKVFADLAVQPVRLVRSPPGSGKTSFGALLKQYATSAGHTVRLLDMNLWAASRKTLEEEWKARTGTDMAESLDPTVGERRTFIIDEAQLLYTLGQDHPFWRAVKAINAATEEAPQTAPRVQVLLLAVYGLRARQDQLGTPIEIPSAYSMSLLRLDPQEVQAFFGAYNSTCEAKGYPRISPGLQEAMQRVCNSHVGLLRACVRLYRSTFKGPDPISPQQEADFAASRLVNLGSSHDLRALPILSDVQPAEAVEIRRIALAGEKGIVLTETELRDFPRSLITTGLFDMEPVGSNTIITFSSPAMRTHALRYLFSTRPRHPLDERALSSGASFVREVVQRMYQSDLAGSASTAADGSLLERQYQMSFYAAAISALPRGVHISPDYGTASQPGGLRGYVDFYVNGMYNIGVELTRDGSELQIHEERFSSTGIYAPLKLKSWVVADFRQAVPRKSTLASYPNTVFVVFSSDFGTATIMQHNHKPVEVKLLTD